MRLNLLLFLFSACVFNLRSQTDSSAVPFVAYWSTGDSYNFKVTKVKQTWRDDKLVKNDSTQYIANFEVIDSTEKSYKIRWTFENNLVSTYQIPEKLLEKYPECKRTEIIYTTTENGEFVAIENWEEYGKMMKDVFDAIIETKGGNETEKLRAGMQSLISAYSSRQGIESVVFKELQYFHFPFGIEISTTDTVEYEEKFPHIFGGDPIKGQGLLFIEEVDFDAEYCVLVNRTQMDPEQAKTLLMNVFQQMGVAEENMDEKIKNAKINIRDDNRYTYFYFPGVPALIETMRETTFQMDKEESVGIEKTIIELID